MQEAPPRGGGGDFTYQGLLQLHGRWLCLVSWLKAAAAGFLCTGYVEIKVLVLSSAEKGRCLWQLRLLQLGKYGERVFDEVKMLSSAELKPRDRISSGGDRFDTTPADHVRQIGCLFVGAFCSMPCLLLSCVVWFALSVLDSWKGGGGCTEACLFLSLHRCCCMFAIYHTAYCYLQSINRLYLPF